MRLGAIRRYPVKAMEGESMASAEVDARGLAGDRWYAVTDRDGRFAAAKDSRRFRRRDAVLDYAAETGDDGVVVRRRDGRRWPLGDALDLELSRATGDPVQVLPEDGTPHQDAGQVSLVGTASLAWVSRRLGVDADPRRLRVNLLVETDEPFVEESWTGAVRVGDVVLRPVERVERCRTVDLAQDGLTTTTRLLTALGAARDLRLAIYLDVAARGTLRVGDEVVVG
jgi:uncharacterized protein YcbX